MYLYRKEWNRVRDRLTTIKQPTLSIQTFTKRVGELLDGPSVQDPLYLTITEDQAEWIEKWCGYLTIHSRPESRAARQHEIGVQVARDQDE